MAAKRGQAQQVSGWHLIAAAYQEWLPGRRQVTFNWGGFAAAMGSNLSFQSRNVLSKKLMIGAKVRPDLSSSCLPLAAARPALISLLQLTSSTESTASADVTHTVRQLHGSCTAPPLAL